MVVKKDGDLGLFWTGHPLYDVGLAGLLVFNRKSDPTQLTNEDFAAFAKYAEKAYFSSDMLSSLSVLFTLNNFMNPSYSFETKQKKTAAVLDLNTVTTGLIEELACAYTGLPADDKLARDLIPMLTGRDAINFFPKGQAGLPVSKYARIILQALTVAAPRSQGKAVIAVADDPHLTLEIVGKWQPKIRNAVLDSEIKGAFIRSPRTSLIEILTELARDKNDSEVNSAITVYHLSNSGQGPSINIFFLPAIVTRFVIYAQNPFFKPAWDFVRRQSQARPKEKRKKQVGSDELEPEAKASLPNLFYEALFKLPQNAPYFIARYFKANAKSIITTSVGASERKYEDAEELLASLWNLIELFLKEIVAMDKQRIEAIRKLGDVLAEEVAEENDRRLFGKLTVQVRTFADLRNQLIKVKKQRLISQREPVPNFDDFLIIFEEGEEVVRTDWRLAWDLTQIRLLDELHRRNWHNLAREILEQQEQERKNEDEDEDDEA